MVLAVCGGASLGQLRRTGSPSFLWPATYRVYVSGDEYVRRRADGLAMKSSSGHFDEKREAIAFDSTLSVCVYGRLLKERQSKPAGRQCDAGACLLNGGIGMHR